MTLVIPNDVQAYFDNEEFKADPKNPYNREDGTVQHRFIKRDSKNHIVAEVWLNEEKEVSN